jgi:TRAP-type C4-dicarboxylate transport system permease small subunit
LATARGTRVAYQFYEEQNGQFEPDKISERVQDLTMIEWLTLPITAAGIVIAWGMWTLRPAAWFATMTLQGLSLAAQLYDYSQGQNVYPQLLVTVLTVFYLNQHAVKLVFRTRSTPASEELSS